MISQAESCPGADYSNVRVIKRNLVYIMGLSMSAGETILRKHDHFGQFGSIKKIIVNPLKNSTACAYITYERDEEAERCIRMVDESVYGGRVIRCTYGTTKYCTFFLKNIPCQNHLNGSGRSLLADCMYLHEVKPATDILKKDELLKSKLHTFDALNRNKEILGVRNKRFAMLDELFKLKTNKSFPAPKTITFQPKDINTEMGKQIRGQSGWRTL
ncbi:ring zinc finger transcriptional negative regulator [Enterospora canceri]|uniref:Ring zinc finger transcriptional negative regulator n=1 Tax=Enterospora canceri TaxID=1081671 RepID=A0A1Y1S535_9MICR|nr:ring zinc finger transcriptional negative regulator [Enterospora canceri]ORD93516.1 ring zinc finger transcriptional negative regulator [Enterospora canceri]